MVTNQTRPFLDRYRDMINSNLCKSQRLDQEELDNFLTVFEGSSPEDVSHARHFWRSQSLLPPLESRLVSADIRQRLPVSRPRGSSSAGPKLTAPEPRLSVPGLRQRQEERRRYEAMAEQRKEILKLLKKQREQRIQRELVSVGFKPRVKSGKDRTLELHDSADSEMDKEVVKQLQ